MKDKLMKNEKVILAYSGGLDTSVIAHWLSHKKGYEVICFVADVGQQDDFQKIKSKALASGATKVYVKNLCQEFVEDFIFTALKSNAIYEGSYLLGTALARPLIAKYQIQCALQEEAQLLAHGATGKGNDQVRFELTYACLMPTASVISPWKDEQFLAQFKGRSDLLAYAHKHKIPVTSTQEKPYSIDENLMHTSYESGVLEDPAQAPKADMFLKTAPIDTSPNEPAHLTLTFKQGIPVAVINDVNNELVTGPVNIMSYLNKVGGIHGVGRVDMVENRFVGIKSRGVYETPGGTILHKAHKDLESITLDKEVAHLMEHFALYVAQLIYNGFWFSPEMEVLKAAINKSQEHVHGQVSLSLYKGNIIITGRKSSNSLYDIALASMQELGGYNQLDAKGFIALHALRLKLAAKKVIS